MKLADFLSEAKEVPSFVAYVLSKMRNEFSDLSEVEDLFDYAYLEDCEIDLIAQNLKKSEDAAKELTSRLNFLIQNINDKAYSAKMKAFAKEWVKLATPAVIKAFKDYEGI